MKWPYGYIRRTEGTDGDHVDCYIGPNPEAKFAYVVHQNDPVTGKFDEDKVMLGFDSAKEAKAAYIGQYNRPGFFGSMAKMSMADFKAKVAATFDKPGMVALAAPEAINYFEPMPDYHPPSLTDPLNVPVDNPGETDDRFMDVTNRNSPGTKAFRDKLTQRTGRPEFIRHSPSIDPSPQHWE
jgi:hypothetical protein